MVRWAFALAAAVLVISGCNDNTVVDSVTSTTDGSTTTSLAADAGTGGGCGEPVPAQRVEPPENAVRADLDGNGEDDTAWVTSTTDPPSLQAIVGDAAFLLDLPEDPVTEPAIESVVDIGDERDTLLVRTGAGAYTELFTAHGMVDCEFEALIDSGNPDPEPFVLARGASVQNGADFFCSERDHGTVITTRSWTTGESGDFEWVETTYVRQGASLVVVGEPVTGTADSEGEIGTGAGEECPAPVAA